MLIENIRNALDTPTVWYVCELAVFRACSAIPAKHAKRRKREKEKESEWEMQIQMRSTKQLQIIITTDNIELIAIRIRCSRMDFYFCEWNEIWVTQIESNFACDVHVSTKVWALPYNRNVPSARPNEFVLTQWYVPTSADENERIVSRIMPL